MPDPGWVMRKGRRRHAGALIVCPVDGVLPNDDMLSLN